jgi:hypothetical protein
MSSIWVLFNQRNEVYVGVRHLAGTMKLSLHSSGVCQLALTQQYWNGLDTKEKGFLPDRSLARWKRKCAPIEGAVEVMSVWFPRDWQKGRLADLPSKPIFMIEPASPSQAVRLGLFETRESPTTLEDKLGKLGLPVGYIALDDGRSFSIVVRHEAFNPECIANVVQGSGRAHLFDSNAAPRPGEVLQGLTALAFDRPADGEPLRLVEVTGIALQRNPPPSH